jgi:hypothetical protein
MTEYFSFNTVVPELSFDIEIAFNSQESIINRYDPLDFEIDNYFTGIETTDETHKLTLGSNFSESAAIRVRHVYERFVGAWSDVTFVNREDSSFIVNILPQHTIFSHNARWIIEKDGIEYGPYLYSGNDITDDTYNLTLVDLAGNTLKEESDISNNYSSYLESSKGSVKVTLTTSNSGTYTYLLISDFNETGFQFNRPDKTLDNLDTGIYYISMKRNNQSIQYLNDTIQNSITIVEDTLKNINIYINEDNKIAVVEEEIL